MQPAAPQPTVSASGTPSWKGEGKRERNPRVGPTKRWWKQAVPFLWPPTQGWDAVENLGLDPGEAHASRSAWCRWVWCYCRLHCVFLPFPVSFQVFLGLKNNYNYIKIIWKTSVFIDAFPMKSELDFNRYCGQWAKPPASCIRVLV